MGVRAITVEEASLTTMSVEIKSLIVSGKQMTLSVFRQLLRAPLIDDKTGELRGVPWGFVNYFWKDNEQRRWNSQQARLHVVWQQGDRLYRDLVECEWTWYDERKQENWQASVVVLRALPQLFIAV
jgi:hypothetical protein